MSAGFKFMDPSLEKQAIELPATSATYSVGDLIELVVGSTSWGLCTTGSTCSTRKAIVTKGGTTVTTVYAVILNGNERIEAGTDNNSAAADNGDSMILGTATTGAMTINNTGTTVASTETEQQFVQQGTIGAAADKRIWGYVQVGNGVLMTAST